MIVVTLTNATTNGEVPVLVKPTDEEAVAAILERYPETNTSPDPHEPEEYIGVYEKNGIRTRFYLNRFDAQGWVGGSWDLTP